MDTVYICDQWGFFKDDAENEEHFRYAVALEDDTDYIRAVFHLKEDAEVFARYIEQQYYEIRRHGET